MLVNYALAWRQVYIVFTRTTRLTAPKIVNYYYKEMAICKRIIILVLLRAVVLVTWAMAYCFLLTWGMSRGVE